MSSAEDKTRGFVVSDRRAFTPGGETRTNEGQPGESKAESRPAETPKAGASGPGPKSDDRREDATESPVDEFSAHATVPGGAAVEFSASATVAGGPAVRTRRGTGEVPAGERPLPPVDFPTFVLSLGSSALMHMGEIENPSGGGASRNLPMAKHSIDILSMLQEKTKGNLSTQEAQLLENLLYDLKLRYVTAAKAPPK